MNEYLDIVDGKINAKVIYEDDVALAFLAKNGTVPGEIILIPKKKYQIMELIPDEEMAHLAVLARKLSDACFEILSGQGTNILIQNGIPAGQLVPQFSIRILPRRDGDGVNFKWTTEKESESELKSVSEILYSETKNIFISTVKAKHKEIEIPKKQEKVKEQHEEGDIDYRLDFFRNKEI